MLSPHLLLSPSLHILIYPTISTVKIIYSYPHPVTLPNIPSETNSTHPHIHARHHNTSKAGHHAYIHRQSSMFTRFYNVAVHKSRQVGSPPFPLELSPCVYWAVIGRVSLGGDGRSAGTGTFPLLR
ncbi:unnamed protein product [Periconia digitata]|uniref:Uncharacterized protein n=1 Tax=Periconia digitata TaxID=1303443 RepID=A0A9W4UJ96_9PLEO|nr:unnamed protein product [Periconia digitata]